MRLRDWSVRVVAATALWIFYMTREVEAGTPHCREAGGLGTSLVRVLCPHCHFSVLIDWD